MRSRIFAVLAVAILAGGGLAYGTYNMVNNQAPAAAAATETSRSWWPPRTCSSAPSSSRAT